MPNDRVTISLYVYFVQTSRSMNLNHHFAFLSPNYDKGTVGISLAFHFFPFFLFDTGKLLRYHPLRRGGHLLQW